VVDMLYAGIFRLYPKVQFILAHCGASLPALSGRLFLLGNEPWVPNPNNITKDEIKEQLSGFFLDTAAAGTAHTLSPALQMTSCDHIVYGSDCGVPCTSDASYLASIQALLQFPGLAAEEIGQIGHNALKLFPAAAERISIGKMVQ